MEEEVIDRRSNRSGSLTKVLAGAGAGLAAGLYLAGKDPWFVKSDLPRMISIETDPIDSIPSEADVVVIGGGISGITTALHLNAFGLKTVVFEKGVISGEASSRNFGWIYSNAVEEPKLPLAELAKEQWFGFAERFGFDVTARQTGNLALATTEEELQQHREWLEMAKSVSPSVDSVILTAQELDAVVPGASREFAGALHQPSDGTAEPAQAVPLIAKGARQEGVQIFERTAVRGLEFSGDAIASVVTEHGRVHTPKVVVAGGAWSSYFLNNLGVDLPEQNIASSMLRLGNGTAGPGAAMGGDINWREELSGTVSVGATSHVVPVELDSFKVLPAFSASIKELLKDPLNIPLRLSIGPDLIRSLRRKRTWSNDEVTEFERVRMLTNRHNPGSHKATLKALKEFFPTLKDAEVIERWGGVLDATPDYLPVIDSIDSIPGLYVNTGHAGMGFSLGPGGGRLMAEIVADKNTSVDPTGFRFTRFHDGSKLTIGHML